MSSSKSAEREDDGSERPRPLSELASYLHGIFEGGCDEDLLRRAMTHRSYAYEHDNAPHNERLEFLGDAVLGLVVTDALYHEHPDLPEGQLAKLRAAVVNTRALADVARSRDLGSYVLLGRGEEATGGRDKASILADTTEALIGCVYLTCGMHAASELVHHLLDDLMRRSAQWGAGLDWKTSLQELVSTAELDGPEYVVENEGPDHDKTFTARAVVGEEVVGTGEGTSKKAAEQRAAEQAWNLLTARAAAMLQTEATEALSADQRRADELAQALDGEQRRTEQTEQADQPGHAREAPAPEPDRTA
ncbi:MAG TPA: ribonuclease III [Ornithinimicrobium sp.]|uniref:ribonuclease III n=1 Tax=Ornithinimicrobium sp. TaxID=1977084 RepID=UPI002B490C8B|nr:ribonuclease III [Ornithinimicrobium sp.]HKJ10899.1 ribonuclease III [Ornithinimicrobium sp.]